MLEPKPADNKAVHTEDGIGSLHMKNQIAVPGDGNRYPTEITNSLMC
jgi:hypothetical protein